MNTDGIDPDCCRNVVISDCIVQTGDDGIAVKTSSDVSCENIVITNCLISSRETAFKLGTESFGNIRNVSISNSIIHGSRFGCALYLKDGGNFENVQVSNCTIESDAEYAIVIDNTPRYYDTSPKGAIRNVSFTNLQIHARGRCYVEGLHDFPIENLSFRDIQWNICGAIELEKAEKPWGSMCCRLNPDSAQLARQPFRFIAAYTRGLQCSDIRFISDGTDGHLKSPQLYLYGSCNATIKNILVDDRKDGYVKSVQCSNICIDG
ncbi:MAG: hypothetical protein GF350_15220 [Chitinivibrionales bacterium]|nr:hypothetical protein [Chitinivibrionales bacterium]